MKNKRIIQVAERLNAMLTWSDRLGSDERNEIIDIIEILEK